MTENQEKAYKKALIQLKRLRDKAQVSADKDKEKRSKKYVIICGEECHTDQEVLEWWQCDYITEKQCETYRKKLEKLKNIDTHEMGVNDCLVELLTCFISDCYDEIRQAEFDKKSPEEKTAILEENIRISEERNKKREERISHEFRKCNHPGLP